MNAIKLTPTQRRAVLRTAKHIADDDGYSCFLLNYYSSADVVKKYGKFFERDSDDNWLHYADSSSGIIFARNPTQNERVLMLLLFAEACK